MSAAPLDVTLVRPSESLLESYRSLLDELRAAGDPVWPTRLPADDEGDADFVARLIRASEPTQPLPSSVWWGVAEGEVVGVIVVRHHLTPALTRYGGHVSYEVRPSARRRGVGTAMLAAALRTEPARLVGTLRITCAPDNTGSRRIIEACGGVRLDTLYVEAIHRPTCRYDLPCPARPRPASRCASCASHPRRGDVGARCRTGFRPASPYSHGTRTSRNASCAARGARRRHPRREGPPADLPLAARPTTPFAAHGPLPRR